MSFQFIINPLAGQGKYKQIIHDIHKILSNCDLRYEIAIPQYKGEATLIAKKAAAEHDVIVAVGGDGTINEVLNGILGTQAILGIIPAGTGNGFAREFALPLHPKKACKVLLEGHTKWVDVGQANDKYFLGTSGLGFDALIAKFAGGVLGPLRGMWLYFFAGVLMFYRYKPQLITIEIDSQTIETRPLLIAIANTKRYGGRALIAPHATPDDGLFDVCVIQNMKSLRLLRHLPKLFRGKHLQLPEVKIYKGNKITINASEPLPMHVDGEPIDGLYKMQFTLLPKAIKILVPSSC